MHNLHAKYVESGFVQPENHDCMSCLPMRLAIGLIRLALGMA